MGEAEEFEAFVLMPVQPVIARALGFAAMGQGGQTLERTVMTEARDNPRISKYSHATQYGEEAQESIQESHGSERHPVGSMVDCLPVKGTGSETVAVMMTPRQRMLAAFDYGSPDRIPVVYHSSPAGLYVHGQKLLDLFNRYPPDNPIHFDSVPIPPAGALDEDGKYHELRVDSWGTEWEYRIFGIQGHSRRYPFPDWSAARDYVFPALPAIDVAEVARQREQHMVFSEGVSIFEKLCALRPMDQVLMDIQMKDADLMAFLDRLVDYWSAAIRAMLAAGVDAIAFGDDWGTQKAPIISPAVFSEVFKPRYDRLMAPIRQADRVVFFHACGFLGPIVDELLELGVKGLWPQTAFFESDPSYSRKCREHGVAIYIHPDRQRLVPRGTPAEIRARIRDYASQYRQMRGGGIFYVEIENDAPWDNVQALIEAVGEYR